MSEAIYAALIALGYPVARIYLKKEKYSDVSLSTYLTYTLITETLKLHADDDTEAREQLWRVDLYTKTEYEATLAQITAALKGAGFYGVSKEAETYETGTGYYHVSLECRSYEMEGS